MNKIDITNNVEELRNYLGECIIDYYEFLMDDQYGEILPYNEDDAFIIISLEKNYYYRELKDESVEGLRELYRLIVEEFPIYE